MRLRPLLCKISPRLRWAPHNLVGHPLMEVLEILGLTRASRWVHDVTLPSVEQEEP